MLVDTVCDVQEYRADVSVVIVRRAVRFSAVFRTWTGRSFAT